MPWQERFPIHEIGRIDGGRGFQTRKNVFRIDGNTFYDRKNKIPMKIPESKRCEIRIIAEFRGIPNGFPNLALEVTGKNYIKNSQVITIKKISNTSKYRGQVDTTKTCKTSKRSNFHENFK
jgi:hypothetical protein